MLCVLVLLQCEEAKCVDIEGGVVGKREAQAQEVWVGCSDGEKIQNISKSCILDPSTFSKLRSCIIFTFFSILFNKIHPMCIITQLLPQKDEIGQYTLVFNCLYV